MAELIDQWTNVVSSERNNIVFENRNKAYGAFYIRQEYTRTIIIALFSTISGVMLLSSVPKVVSFFKPDDNTAVIHDAGQVEPPVITVTIDPPPVVPPSTEKPQLRQPVTSTPAPTTPVVVDNSVPDENHIQQTEEPHSGAENPNAGGDPAGSVTEPATAPAPVEVVDNTPMLNPEVKPEFPGGINKMYDFLRQNLSYPTIEHENGIQGKVYMTFVVDRSGNIQDIKILHGVAGGPNLEKEALRVIKLMPKWKPGKQGGKEVPVQFILPIMFALRE